MDDTDFKFYIPKWRVPKPWPGRIFVDINSFSGDPSNFTQISPDLHNLENSIELLVKPIKKCTKTSRYSPLGEEGEWQIGEPYIPISRVPSNSHFLIIKVMWDLDSKGQFVEVPTYREDP